MTKNSKDLAADLYLFLTRCETMEEKVNILEGKIIELEELIKNMDTTTDKTHNYNLYDSSGNSVTGIK